MPVLSVTYLCSLQITSMIVGAVGLLFGMKFRELISKKSKTIDLEL